MKEYTVLSMVSVLATLVTDRAIGTNVLKRKEYYLFLAVILFFKLIVNGYLTSRNIVMYNPRFFMGFRVGSIPFEDFLFGFSMVTLTVVFWEYFSAYRKRGDD